MKKLYVILCALALSAVCLLLCPLQTKAASGDLTFKLVDNKEYWVQACKKTAVGEIVIPSTYNGLPVTGIGQSAFYECEEVTRIIIPEGVREIGSSAFNHCSELTYVSLPETLVRVDESAFYNCGNLPKTTYDNAIYVGSEKNPYAVLFQRTTPDIEQCKIHPNTKAIASGAFMRCEKLKEITIPKGVLGIGDYAFDNCNKMTAVTIPDTVVSLGYGAFRFCEGLTDAYLPDVVTWCKIWRGDMYATPDLFADNIYYDGKKVADLVIPGSITKVSDYAFGDPQFKSITLQEGVKEIGEHAFSSCTGATKLTIADSVTRIGKNAFEGCSSLTDIKFGKGVTELGESAFRSCKGLVSITFPSSLKSIGTRAFEYCTALTSVTVPDNVTNIGEAAFTDCTALETVTLSNGVKSIGASMFRRCSNLKNVKLGNQVTVLGNYAFGNCKALETIDIPRTMKQIKVDVFQESGLKRVVFEGAHAEWIKIEIARAVGDKVNKELLQAEVICLGVTEPVEQPKPDNETNTEPTEETEPAPPTEPTNATEATDATTPSSEEATVATDPAAPTVQDGNREEKGSNWIWIPLVAALVAGGAVAGILLVRKRKLENASPWSYKMKR